MIDGRNRVIPAKTALNIVASVSKAMAHIEPVAALAVTTACEAIDEAFRKELAAGPRSGRIPGPITAAIKALQVGETAHMLADNPDDPAAVAKARDRIARAITNQQCRNRKLKFSRRQIPGGYAVTRLA